MHDTHDMITLYCPITVDDPEETKTETDLRQAAHDVLDWYYYVAPGLLDTNLFPTFSRNLQNDLLQPEAIRDDFRPVFQLYFSLIFAIQRLVEMFPRKHRVHADYCRVARYFKVLTRALEYVQMLYDTKCIAVMGDFHKLERHAFEPQREVLYRELYRLRDVHLGVNDKDKDLGVFNCQAWTDILTDSIKHLLPLWPLESTVDPNSLEEITLRMFEKPPTSCRYYMADWPSNAISPAIDWLTQHPLEDGNAQAVDNTVSAPQHTLAWWRTQPKEKEKQDPGSSIYDYTLSDCEGYLYLPPPEEDRPLGDILEGMWEDFIIDDCESCQV